MDYEKKYKEALQRAKHVLDCDKNGLISTDKTLLLSMFPELKESEDEKIRKELITHCRNTRCVTEEGAGRIAKWIAWLKKQGNIDKASYEIAEKEKYDFVSGQFIECRKSFNEFKEDNSYWLEYVGNDTYIGRSDNILNKKFHITPRQLYRLFTQQHCPKENNVNEETNAPTAYGKYVDECLNDAAKHFFSEGEDKYTVADLFYAGVRCGQSWLERQGDKDKLIEEIKRRKKILLSKREKEKSLRTIISLNSSIAMLEELLVFANEKQGEKKLQAKSAQASGNRHEPNCFDDTAKRFSLNDIIEEISEPKFKVGEWIINKEKKEVFYIRKNLANTYEIVDIEGDDYHIPHYALEKNCHLWAMQDAKNGDVLMADDIIFIFNNIHGVWVNCHCSLHKDGSFMEYDYDLMTIKHSTDVQPATKEWRDLFFQKVKEAGYEWDAEKKVLKKIEDESENYKQETLCDKCRKLQPFYSCQDITSLGRCAFGNL